MRSDTRTEPVEARQAQATEAQQAQATSEVPRTWWAFVRASGPGFAVAMLWLGAGDLVDSSVSGANYGYALVWALVVALVCRYVMVSALAKYQLCNRQGDETILHGYGRMWRYFPVMLGVAGLMIGFALNSFLLRGSAVALYHLTGDTGGQTWGVTIWSVVCVAATLLLVRARNQYRGIEIVSIAAVVVLALTFLIGAIAAGPDLLSMLRGLALEIPPDVGPFGSVLLTVSLIGAVGGSIGNLLYTYFMTEKGWRGPQYRRVQMYDLAAGIASIIVIDLAVWVVAAETLHGTGRVVADENDLAALMSSLVPFGRTLFWLGLFGAAFDSLPGYSFGFTKMFVGAVHQTWPERAERYGGDRESDPLFKVVQIGLLVLLPLVFALPSAPSFVTLTVVSNAVAIAVVPVIIGGLLWLTNNRRLMLPRYVNRWWENLALVVIGLVTLWGTWELLRKLAGQVAELVATLVR